jgi:uncharacterized protein (DUF2249 family)
MTLACTANEWPDRSGGIPTRIKETEKRHGQNCLQLPSRQAFIGAHMQTIHHVHSCDRPTAEALYPFDARGIAKRFRHAAIFGALDALQPGETMRFCNDHDPLPLLAQLQHRYGPHLSIEYKQREPGAIVIDFTVVA